MSPPFVKKKKKKCSKIEFFRIPSIDTSMKISPSPDKYLNIYPKYFSNRIMQDTREYV